MSIHASDHHLRSFWHIRSAELTCPRVRTVAIVVTAGLDADLRTTGAVEHAIYPIIAYRTKVIDHYSVRRSGPCPEYWRVPLEPDSLDPRLMREEGYVFESTEVSHQPMVIDPGYSDCDFGLVPAAELFDCTNQAYTIVPAPWPSSQDEERLADPIAFVRDKALEKAEREYQSRIQPTLTPGG